jgi:uncharacterized membrane protein
VGLVRGGGFGYGGGGGGLFGFWVVGLVRYWWGRKGRDIGRDGEDISSYLKMSWAGDSPCVPLVSIGLIPRATWSAKRGRLRRGAVALRS